MAAEPDLSALESLHVSDHLELLNVIDELRAQGLSSYLPLPQLIVCGDQSSGKSSVLEAISGIPFPKKDNLCTRFATEVILRRDADFQGCVSISPGEERSEADRRQLLDFKHELNSIAELPRFVTQAKEAMGLGSFGNAFSTDVLRLEVSGPRMPRLTIVDLPGLIHSETKLQSTRDVKLVGELVESYMKKQRSVILAVVNAQNDYANQIVLKMAREVDRLGMRTMGIITKPDALNAGSGREASFLGLARNQDIEFKLGWHVVKNVDCDTAEEDAASRDEQEDAFFRSRNWKDLGSYVLGIGSLRERLSTILFNQIRLELPDLIQEIETEIADCTGQLFRLGSSRTTEREQRSFLFGLSQAFHEICKAGCDGNYDHAFFRSGMTQANNPRRLRARIQNENIEFEKTVRTRGAKWQVVEKESDEKDQLSRDQAIDRVMELLRDSRGRELPGTFNPLLIGDLFREYSEPWKKLAHDHVKNAWEASKLFLELVLQHLADEEVSDALCRLVVEEAMKTRLQSAIARLEKILEDLNRHPITYNHYFSDTTTKMEHEQMVGKLRAGLQQFMERNNYLDSQRIESLIEQVLPKSEYQVDKLAAEKTLDHMNAYYKVARKMFTDNIPIQVLEAEILAELPTVFCPSIVWALEVPVLRKIAGESDEKRHRRHQLENKLQILVAGQATCRSYATRMLASTEFSESLAMRIHQSSADRGNLEEKEERLMEVGHVEVTQVKETPIPDSIKDILEPQDDASFDGGAPPSTVDDDGWTLKSETTDGRKNKKKKNRA